MFHFFPTSNDNITCCLIKVFSPSITCERASKDVSWSLGGPFLHRGHPFKSRLSVFLYSLVSDQPSSPCRHLLLCPHQFTEHGPQQMLSPSAQQTFPLWQVTAIYFLDQEEPTVQAPGSTRNSQKVRTGISPKRWIRFHPLDARTHSKYLLVPWSPSKAGREDKPCGGRGEDSSGFLIVLQCKHHLPGLPT